MEIGQLRIKRLRFPGRAGEFQDQGATASLIRELGDNYAPYHDFLTQEARKLGGRPEPKDFNGDYDAYTAACDQARDILVAEALLRRCRAYRKLGQSLNARPDPGEPPLVDPYHRLVSVETGQPDPQGPRDDPTAWEPPPPPG